MSHRGFPILLTLLVLTVCQPVPPPTVVFDTISLADARRLDGTELRITFVPAPGDSVYVVDGTLRTFTGPSETDDEQERTVVLRGDRRGKLRKGEQVKVRGVLRVVHHKEAVVNGVTVPAWDESRFEER